LGFFDACIKGYTPLMGEVCIWKYHVQLKNKIENQIMIAIYCSKKLELFCSSIISKSSINPQNYFGNWVGRIIIEKRKKILLFTNEKTAYSLIFSGVQKEIIKNINSLFVDKFINQLKLDIEITAKQEEQIRKEYQEIVFYQTNNNKSIVGTMNEIVSIIKYEHFEKYGNNTLEDRFLASRLNDYLFGTKLELNNGKYFTPKELMRELLNQFK